jgi:hypothetical protein
LTERVRRRSPVSSGSDYRVLTHKWMNIEVGRELGRLHSDVKDHVRDHLNWTVQVAVDAGAAVCTRTVGDISSFLAQYTRSAVWGFIDDTGVD